MKSNSIYTQQLETQTSVSTILVGDDVDETLELDTSLETAVLSYALKYARRGWPVFPLNGKIPLEGSHGHLDATTDEDQIRKWYIKIPFANIALKTGVEFFVFEVDPRHDGDKTMAALEQKYGPLPETIRQTSGDGGTHYLFALPTDRDVRSSESKVGPGIDVKGHGSHIVAEPSLHPRTKEFYTFQNLDEAELTECPGWLLDLVCPVRTENLKTPSKKDAPAPVVPISDDLISDGERNHKLFRHAASLRGSAMNGNEILAALSIVNDERCVPPLNVDELQKIVKSVSRYEPNEIKKPLVMRRAQKAHLIEVQALLSDEATPYADEDWMGRLELTSEGKPFKNIANVVRVLEYHPEFNKAIAWNESTQRFVALRPTCAGRIPAGTALTDYHILELTVWIQSHTDVKVGEKVVNSAVETVGMRYAFHPIRDYLNGLKHDGVKRVDGWLTKYLGVKQTAYTDAVGRAWLVSAIARVMRPGCKADCGLILEGDTGLGKSTVFKVLGGEWFSESLKSMDQDKDALAQLRGKWIVEMAELSQMTRGEVSAIKHFMSTSVDTYRPSYGRRAQDFPRECIFGGTSNLNNYLKDETGNRRFWPVECQAVIDGKWIDRDGLQEDRDQLWAEALEMYEAGEKWYLDDPKVLRMSVEEQESRLELDPWHEPVIAYCEDKAKQDIKEELDTDALQRVKIEDILKGKFDHDGKVVVGIGKPIIQWTQADRLRIGRILKLEGWKRCQQRVPGKVECVFTKAFPLKTGDR